MTKAFSLQKKDDSSFSVKYIEQRVILNYVRIQTNSNKFYMMEFQEGEGECPYRIYIHYGRTGSPPRRHERYFQSRSEAKQAFDTTLIAKRKKGYELILVEEDWDQYSHLPLELTDPSKLNHPDPQSPTLSINTPLGKLSEIQLHRGVGILTEIEQKHPSWRA